ncbi:MAG: LysR family transcriptional regulator, partial [Candidatus Rokuibacteriota bacterium]
MEPTKLQGHRQRRRIRYRAPASSSPSALHRSQPAISRRIEMLEEQLGTPVFERVRGGVVLTEAGRSFLPYAEAVLASMK